jgi:hypothetical protein
MPKVCFWNMRHLGEGSDGDRKASIKATFSGIGADYTLFCELTGTSIYPKARNLTYRQKNSAQLCYGCLDDEDDDIVIQKYTPLVTPEYTVAKYKGGSDFTELADRAVGYIGVVGGVPIYVIHAPSGGEGRPGRKAMSFIACHFNAVRGNNPWLIIGDFNVEPPFLAQSRVGIQMFDLIHAPKEYTYEGPKENKIFDYVLCNFPVNVTRIRASSRGHGSDHYPIVAEW